MDSAGSTPSQKSQTARWDIARFAFSSPWEWLRAHDLLLPVGLFLFLRVWLSFWAAVAARFIPPLAASVKTQYYGMAPLTGEVNQILWAPWQRWDTIWYTKIAEQGYSPTDLSAAFFPLYPLLIKLSAPLLGNNSVAAGVVVSSLAALASFILLYRLATQEWGRTAAQRTLVYLALFPTAFILFAAYTESLFLALVLASFLAARSGKWWLAGIFGALAGLTRPQGMFVLLPLGVEFLMQYRRGKVSIVQVLNLAWVAVGGVAFWVYLAIKFNNLLVGLQVKSAGRQLLMPWDTLGIAFQQVLGLSNRPSSFFAWPDLIITVLFLGVLVWSIFRLSPTWTAYIAIILLPPLFGLTTYNALLPLASMSRYALVAFPGFFLLSAPGIRSLGARSLMGVLLILQTFWLILFVAWVLVA